MVNVILESNCMYLDFYQEAGDGPSAERHSLTDLNFDISLTLVNTLIPYICHCKQFSVQQAEYLILTHFTRPNTLYYSNTEKLLFWYFTSYYVYIYKFNCVDNLRSNLLVDTVSHLNLNSAVWCDFSPLLLM